MRIRLAPRRKFIILLLLTLALSAATAGIYLLVSDDTSIPYTIDKYSDTLDWCEPNAENGELKIDCKALLLSIKNQEDNSTCFDVQVISNAKELKDLTVCERVGTLTYTSEVASYKILMPVDIVFTYTQELLNNFSFKNVSFTALDGTYVQNIVNEDIANLITTNIDHHSNIVSLDDGNEVMVVNQSSYTVSNSVDVCPKPETLSSYLSEKNTAQYQSFYKNNISDDKSYTQSTLENFGDNIIDKLFACKSATTLDYDVCNLSKTLKLPSNLIKIHNTNIKWGYNMDTQDIFYLKSLSLLYDRNYYKNPTFKTLLPKSESLFEAINDKSDLNENTFCATYFIYEELSNNTHSFVDELEYIRDLIFTNIKFFKSPLCGYVIDNISISKEGLYLKQYLGNLSNKGSLRVYSSCTNLTMLLNEK